jgi:hypothetical protein
MLNLNPVPVATRVLFARYLNEREQSQTNAVLHAKGHSE